MADVTVTATDDTLVVSRLPGPCDAPAPLSIELGDDVVVTVTDTGFEIAGLPGPDDDQEA